MGSERRSTRSLAAGTPPPPPLQPAAADDRRRSLARALHEPPQAHARGISDRLDSLRTEIARYREAAIALHARLLELETSRNDNVTSIRQTLIASSVRLEGAVRDLTDAPDERRKR